MQDHGLTRIAHAFHANKRWHRFGPVTPVANGILKWGDWKIEHSDDGIHVDRVYYPRSKPVTFSASITCAINEGELTCYRGGSPHHCETRQLTQAQINQLAYVECIYADANLYNDLLENRE